MHRRMAGSLDLDLRHTDRGHAATADSAGCCLAHDHISRLDEASRQQEHKVVPPSGPVSGELLPIELVPDSQVAAPTPLEVALLEALVARHHLGGAILACGEQQAVVVHGRVMRVLAVGGGGWWGKRHHVCPVVGVLPCGQ